ncbi:MAG TPA: CoA-transferase [Bacillota bacterium]|nr:CoA transferase subunit A [Candidatus Fermentithermobacillaceae bacterium]HOB30026.1 CoA-transferase [Bacillota bacterium]HOK63916.1 CoA-transferase [Bacillota bacterium]HOL11271.1 CoA-transferase [Bacillota bacterium]HOQ02400.1 CoA-transferase [Bacillota bacterium]
MVYQHIADEGIGKLFADPDPDKARDHFRSKSKIMKDKLMSVSEAVNDFVHDGDYLAIGGFGTNRIPTALLHEILRQRKKELRVSGHTATHDFQILAAGDCIASVDVAYVVGLEARGLSKAARKLFEEGRIEVTEWTNAALAWRYRAAAMGIPFMPARVMLGTDTFKYSAAKKIQCPFTGKDLIALPALYPDVALIHVHRADRYGNAQIDGITVSDLDVARASKYVILSTEELIDNEEIREHPSRTAIPYYCVDAVCHVPYGSYPGNMPYKYFSDEEHLNEWLAADGKPETLQPFLSKYIYGTKDFSEYLELCGGLEKIEELRKLEFIEPDGPIVI